MTETKGGRAGEKYTIMLAMKMEEGAMSQGTQRMQSREGERKTAE